MSKEQSNMLQGKRKESSPGEVEKNESNLPFFMLSTVKIDRQLRKRRIKGFVKKSKK